MPKSGRELIDAEVEEISLVDRPANKKRFLFLKRLEEEIKNKAKGGEKIMLDKIQKIADVIDKIELDEDSSNELKEGIADIKKELSALDASLVAEDKAREKEKEDAKGEEIKKDVEGELGKINAKLDKIVGVLSKKPAGYPEKEAAGEGVAKEKEAKELEKQKEAAVGESLTALKDISEKMLSKEDVGKIITDAVGSKP